MSTFNNQAAWYTGPGVHPFKVESGPIPNPGPDEVVIKVGYTAINPSDWKLQESDIIKLNYPHILGSDISGQVVKLGTNVTRFQIGQRVIGHCLGLSTGKATDAAFQLYSTCKETVMSPVPDSIPLANAAVLPLAISTAATGLFEIMNLQYPSVKVESTGKTILVWGGSSSCGSATIQLAVAAGYSVVSTASPKNFEFVKSLGAKHVFDHSDKDVVDKLVQFLSTVNFAGGYDSIGVTSAQQAVVEVVSKLGGGKVASTLWPSVKTPENVQLTMVYATNPGLTNPELGDAVWRKYVPAGLESGLLQAKPDPYVIEGGLEKVQEGCDVLKKGVSASKIVVEIDRMA